MRSSLFLQSLIPVIAMFAFACIASVDGQEVNRQFEFEYRVQLNNVEGKAARVWIPVAQSDAFQNVEIVEKRFSSEPKLTQDAKYGNQMYYLEFDPKAGDAEVFVKYRVTRNEVKGLNEKAAGSDSRNADKFLAANQLVPVEGKSVELFDAYAKAQNWDSENTTKEFGQNLYHFVREHMAYDKSKPGYGNGNVAWACDSKTGNCTDFHSLFISVARNRKVPAKFEIGFPLPKERGTGEIGGYHCWARFFDKQTGWIPVDISEADKHPEMSKYFFGNLTENRVHFTTGRDISLVPKQQAPPLNYFIYPHVEVDGEVYPTKNIEMKFAYRDIETEDKEDSR